MNSRQPASVQFSLEGFMRRGGDTDYHSDGWGIAFFEEQGCRIITDPLPSVASPLAEQLRHESIKSRNVIAHVRKATHGPVTQSNCHPFQRPLWGRNWVLAHNGRLDNFQPRLSGDFVPAGETDSERAFCLVLQQLREHFGTRAPSLPALHEKLLALAAEIAQYGPFNFLLSEGKYLFAYCSTELSVLQRQAPFGRAQLVDCAASIDFSSHNHVEDRMALVATRPLTHNENWQSFFEGELKLFVDGTESISGVAGVGKLAWVA